VVRVWDPPIVLTPVPSTPEEESVTFPFQENLPVETIAAPGFVPSAPYSPQTTINQPGSFPGPSRRPNSPVQTNSPYDEKPKSDLAASGDFSPRATITLGNSIYTASVLQDPAYVVVGTHTLQAGGPSVVIAGATVSFGQNGRLNVGTSETFNLGHAPMPTTVLQINGKPVTVAVSTSDSNQQDSLVIGAVTLKPGSPATLVNGQLLSFGLDGVLYEGTKSIATISQNSLATNRPSVTANKSGTSERSLTGLLPFGDNDLDNPRPATSGRKKKSGAGRLSDILPSTLTFFGLVVGAWLRLCIC